ncbi:MAG: type II secretion system minor pseudopilin GspK [Vibrio sp.]
MRNKHSQQGVALIVILLIVAIMVSLAATMSARMFTQFQRATHQINYQQAYWYSIGVEGLATSLLKQTRKKDSKTINLSQVWAIKDRTFPLDYGSVSGQIYDKQACFNLNVFSGLVSAPGVAVSPYPAQVFTNLLQYLNVESNKAGVITDSLWEFVDTNDTVNTTYGMEDSYYDSLSPAYLPPNGMMVDSSELRAVQGVSGKVMEQLKPYVCAIPTAEWKLNINTITQKQALLLVAMFSPNLTEADAKALIKNRPKKGWSSVADFMSEPQLARSSQSNRQSNAPNAATNANQYLTVSSHYFELDAQVLVDKSRVRVRSLIHNEDKSNATVIRRRYGGISERIFDRSTE